MKAPSAGQSYTLCGLVSREDATTQFSPYVWTTIIDLRYLEVDYGQRNHTFDHLRTNLTKELGTEDILLPVLRDAEGGWTQDSFEIGLYLDRAHAHPQGRSLFLHGEGGREFCRFVNYWADTVLCPALLPVMKARIWSTIPLDSSSSSYFARSRFGSINAAHTALRTSHDSSFTSEHFAASRRCLRLINTMLAYQNTQGKMFIGGDFSHADAAVFGWYVWSVQFAPETRREVWETEENREVSHWVEEMRSLQGWEEGDFEQIPAVISM